MPDMTYLLASAYAGISSLYGAVAATCRVNGQLVECPRWLGAASTGFFLAELVLVALMIVSFWIIFKKAGKPGWAAIVPIYNTIVMLQIAGKPLWWILLVFIPFVNIIIAFIIIYNLAKNFGKGGGFAAGLIFLPFIFYPILAFGKSTYLGAPQPAESTTPPTPPASLNTPAGTV